MSKRPLIGGKEPARKVQRIILDDDDDGMEKRLVLMDEARRLMGRVRPVEVPVVAPAAPPPTNEVDAMDIDEEVEEESLRAMKVEKIDMSERLVGYIRLLCLPGADQLPLFRLLLTEVLRGSASNNEEEMRPMTIVELEAKEALEYREHDARIMSLFNECRRVLLKQGARDLPFTAADGELRLLSTATKKDFKQFESTRHLQAHLTYLQTDERTSLYDTAHGMVTAFAPDIPIDRSLRAKFVENLVTVLRHGILLTPHGDFSIFRNELPDILKEIIRSIYQRSGHLLLHLCAEVVAYVIRHADEVDIISHPMYEPLCDLIKSLGDHFALYLFNMYPTEENFFTRERFLAYGFLGDYDHFNSITTKRRSILMKLIQFEQRALNPEIALKDFQRNLVVDMIIQELLPRDVINEKQAGIHGLLVYAAPGTGKTMMALIAAVYLNSLGHDPDRKTLLVVPSTAEASFVNDAYERFNDSYRPHIHRHGDGDYELCVPSTFLQPMETEWKRKHEKRKLSEIQFLLFEPTKAEKIPWGHVTDEELRKYEEKHSNEKHDAKTRRQKRVNDMRDIVKQPWRVFVDESHNYTTRTNFSYVLIRHWLNDRGPTFLLTGTAFVRNYYDIMSQMRLMGYQVRLDKTIKGASAADAYREIDENLPIAVLQRMINDKVWEESKAKIPKRKHDLALENAIISEHRSVPVYRAIRRLTENVLGNMGLKGKSFEFIVQPDIARATRFYERLDIALHYVFGERVRGVTAIMEKIDGLQATKLPETFTGPTLDELADATAEKKEESPDAERRDVAFNDLFNADDSVRLRKLLDEHKVLVSTRNYGVDLRVLSANQLKTLKSRLTRSIDAQDLTDDIKALIARVREEIETIKPYRPNKNTRKPVLNNEMETDDSRLSLVEEIATGTAVSDVKDPKERWKRELEKIRDVLKAGKDETAAGNDMPTRYRKVLQRLRNPVWRYSEKAVIFARDRDVMKSFLLWMLLDSGEEYRILRRNEEMQKADEEAFPNAKFVAVLDSSMRKFDDRRKLVSTFTGNKRLCLVVTTYNLASTGLNLQAANVVVHLQAVDIESDYLQATARVYRIGQTKEVIVVECISKNTGEIMGRAERLLRKRLMVNFDEQLASLQTHVDSTPFDLTLPDYEAILQRFDGAPRAPVLVQTPKRVLIEVDDDDDDDDIMKTENNEPGRQETENKDTERQAFFLMLPKHAKNAKEKNFGGASIRVLQKDIEKITAYDRTVKLSPKEREIIEKVQQFLQDAANGNADVEVLAFDFESILTG
jgi:superfamily II DNA or RNA helicase